MKITTTLLCVLAGMTLIPFSLALAQTDAQRIDRPVWPPAGSTWIVQTKSTGSLGSGSKTATRQALGEQDWEGRRVIGLTSGGGFYLYFDDSRRIVAQVRDGKPVQTYDPLRPYTTGPCLWGSRG